jgi:hypothetical protein
MIRCKGGLSRCAEDLPINCGRHGKISYNARRDERELLSRRTGFAFPRSALPAREVQFAANSPSWRPLRCCTGVVPAFISPEIDTKLALPHRQHQLSENPEEAIPITSAKQSNVQESRTIRAPSHQGEEPGKAGDETMKESPLLKLKVFGQSIWMD